MDRWSLYWAFLAIVLASVVARGLLKARVLRLRQKGATADVDLDTWNPVKRLRNIAFYAGGFRQLADPQLGWFIAAYVTLQFAGLFVFVGLVSVAISSEMVN